MGRAMFRRPKDNPEQRQILLRPSGQFLCLFWSATDTVSRLCILIQLTHGIVKDTCSFSYMFHLCSTFH